MSKERLKYRVWDVENEKYIDPELCLIDGNGRFFYRDYVNGRLYNWTEDFVVEKCIGRKDKKGKLIFAGDNCRLMSRGCTFVVVFGNSEHDFEVIENKEWEHMLYAIDYESIEIIGNVHEDKGNEQKEK